MPLPLCSNLVNRLYFRYPTSSFDEVSPGRDVLPSEAITAVLTPACLLPAPADHQSPLSRRRPPLHALAPAPAARLASPLRRRPGGDARAPGRHHLLAPHGRLSGLLRLPPALVDAHGQGLPPRAALGGQRRGGRAGDGGAAREQRQRRRLRQRAGVRPPSPGRGCGCGPGDEQGEAELRLSGAEVGGEVRALCVSDTARLRSLGVGQS